MVAQAVTGTPGSRGTVTARQSTVVPARLTVTSRDDRTGLSALLIVALTLLIGGLGLFALRWSARRL